MFSHLAVAKSAGEFRIVRNGRAFAVAFALKRVGQWNWRNGLHREAVKKLNGLERLRFSLKSSKSLNRLNGLGEMT